MSDFTIREFGSIVLLFVIGVVLSGLTSPSIALGIVICALGYVLIDVSRDGEQKYKDLMEKVKGLWND